MIRRWLLPILGVGFLWLLIARRAELRLVLATLASGEWGWVAVAAAVLAGYYLAYAVLYRMCLAAAGVSGPLAEALVTVLGSLFVNALVPSAGAALWIDGAARRRQSPARAAAGVLLAFAIDFAALAVLVLASLAYLSRRGDLGTGELAGAAMLALVIGAAGGALALGAWRAPWLSALLRGLEGAARRLAATIGRAPPLAPGWADRTAGEWVAVAAALRDRPGRLAGPLGVALALHLLGVASVGALFLAFHQRVHPPALMAGYAFGVLAWVLSPIPQGIGVVEGVIALVYASLGVPAEAATAIALAFRGLVFWLPMLVGFLLLRRLRSLRVDAS